MQNVKRYTRYIFYKAAAFVLAGFIMPAGPGPASSEELYELDTIFVEAQRDGPAPAEADATSFVTVIRPDELTSRATSVTEVLDQSVGVTVKQYGGLGSFSTVSIRGSSSEQVSVYLDGVLLNRAVSGVVNLADIPLDSVEKIEVYRGSSPARFGAEGIGGVVNIITKKAGPSRTVDAGYSFGSFETHRANLLLAQTFKRVNYSILYNRIQSEGDFEFKDDRGTTYNKNDDSWTHRRNNDFHADDVLVKTTLDLPSNMTLDISSDTFKKKQGIPGIGTYQSRRAELATLRNLSQLRLTKDSLFSPALRAELLVSYSFQRQEFEDRFGEIGIGRQDNEDDTKTLTTRLFFSWLVGTSHIVNLMGEVRRETYQSEDRLASCDEQDTVKRIGYLYGFTGSARAGQKKGRTSEKQKRYTCTLSLEDEMVLFSERLVLNPSVKYSWYDNDFGGAVPFSALPISPEQNKTDDHLSRKVGALLRLTDRLTLKANVGKYYRIPNFHELFGDRGAIVGNTDLVAERGLNWDIGLTLTGSPIPQIVQSLHLEYAWFSSTIDNLILFIQNSQRTSVAMNISRAKISGHELFWRIRLRWPVLISGNYTYQDTEDRSDVAFWKGNHLPGRPKHELFNRIEVFTARFRLFHELDVIGENYLDRANVRKISGRTVQNLGCSWTPTEKVTLTVEVKNITDRHTEDVAGYPLPGRAYFAAVDLKL